MAHLRQQIRDAVVTAVTGLTTTGSNVEDTRFYRVEESGLPGLFVYTNDEEISYQTKGTSRQFRSLEVIIDAIAQSASGADDTLDTIIKEVEVALANSTLSGLVKTLTLTRIQALQDAAGKQPMAGARIIYTVNYHTFENDPETAA